MEMKPLEQDIEKVQMEYNALQLGEEVSLKEFLKNQYTQAKGQKILKDINKLY
jgi:hypothetical protein